MVAALPAARADMTCSQTSPIPPGSTVNGNLVVPAGSNSCLLLTVTVTGNVQVQTNAALTIVAGGPSKIVGNVSVGTGATVDTGNGILTIDGNLVANQCLGVLLGEGFAVGGNVQIQNCTGESDVGSGDIGGNVGCNNSGTCDVSSNKVNGNVQINDNSSAQVLNNTIGNNLQCQGNAAITGGGNTVGGQKMGQCANF
jgi:hypothetical protein